MIASITFLFHSPGKCGKVGFRIFVWDSLLFCLGHGDSLISLAESPCFFQGYPGQIFEVGCDFWMI